jgi:hypothetical protein
MLLLLFHGTSLQQCWLNTLQLSFASAAAAAAAAAAAVLAFYNTLLPHLCSCSSHAGLQQRTACSTHCHQLVTKAQQQQQ